MPKSRASARIRYAVVGLGRITQRAVLPAFVAAGRNSQLTALVSGDTRKSAALAARYGGARVFGYDDYDQCLSSVDAVFIALPNSMHAEYTIRAARAGVHVLCEKPMAVTVAECEQMIAACRRHRVKLMIAYRLRLEAITQEVIGLVRKGRIGEPKHLLASFSFVVGDGNVRTKKALGGGTLYDVGVYCINAARHIFDAEPDEVLALAVNSDRFAETEGATGALMRFPGQRLATFITSFDAVGEGSYRIVGTKGDILVSPAWEHARGLSYAITVGGKTTRRRGRREAQFADELLHFSDCIRKDREPIPSGEDGLRDVRIVEALYESARTGTIVSVNGTAKSAKGTASA